MMKSEIQIRGHHTHLTAADATVDRLRATDDAYLRRRSAYLKRKLFKVNRQIDGRHFELRADLQGDRREIEDAADSGGLGLKIGDRESLLGH
jgi:hypothetical protein